MFSSIFDILDFLAPAAFTQLKLRDKLVITSEMSKSKLILKIINIILSTQLGVFSSLTTASDRVSIYLT